MPENWPTNSGIASQANQFQNIKFFNPLQNSLGSMSEQGAFSNHFKEEKTSQPIHSNTGGAVDSKSKGLPARLSPEFINKQQNVQNTRMPVLGPEMSSPPSISVSEHSISPPALSPVPSLDRKVTHPASTSPNATTLGQTMPQQQSLLKKQIAANSNNMSTRLVNPMNSKPSVYNAVRTPAFQNGTSKANPSFSSLANAKSNNQRISEILAKAEQAKQAKQQSFKQQKLLEAQVSNVSFFMFIIVLG